MSEEIEYKKLYETEIKKVSVLEQKLRLYELPGDMRGYYTMQKIVNQQCDFFKDFNLESEIKTFSKDDKVYDRASDLWEKLPGNISKLAALKSEVGATGDEPKDTAKKASFLDRNAR